MSGTPNGTPGTVPRIGIMADPHIGQTQSAEMVRTCLQWLVGQGVSAVLVAGDLNEARGGSGFRNWARSPEGGGLPDNVQIVPCVGNWDTEVPPGIYDSTPPEPHLTMLLTYPEQFRGREWYRWSVGGLSVFSLNNLTDYVQDSGMTAYANCNPPGARTVLNPDHSGITNPYSDQRAWLDAETYLVREMPWKVAMMHRPPWSNYDSDPRRMHRDSRQALEYPIEMGLSLVVAGDQHVGCLSGPWHIGETPAQPGHGAYCLVLMGGFQCRPVDDSLLPPGSVLWSRGTSSNEPVCHSATLALGEDVAGLAIFEVTSADPVGSVVHAEAIPRNTGT